MRGLKDLAINILAGVGLFVAILLVLPWLWNFSNGVDLTFIMDWLNYLLDLYVQYIGKVVNHELFS